MEMTGCDFSGPIFGIFASIKDTEPGPPVAFDDFEIS
jgi:hypothetical protein